MVAAEGQTSSVPCVYRFPSSSAGAERQTQTLSGRGLLTNWHWGPGLLGFFAQPSGQRSDMSQVLFQDLVPLQVKCKDCEERWGPRLWRRRVAVGVEPMGKMAAGLSGARSAAVVDWLAGRGKGPCGDPEVTFVRRRVGGCGGDSTKGNEGTGDRLPSL